MPFDGSKFTGVLLESGPVREEGPNELIVEDCGRFFVYGERGPAPEQISNSDIRFAAFLLTNLRKLRVATPEDLARLPKISEYLSKF